MNSKLFSGSIILSDSDSSKAEDIAVLNRIARLNKTLVGNSYYCYIFNSLVLLINPSKESLDDLKQVFSDNGAGISPLKLENN